MGIISGEGWARPEWHCCGPFVTSFHGSHRTTPQGCRSLQEAGLAWRLVRPLTDQNPGAGTSPVFTTIFFSGTSMPPPLDPAWVQAPWFTWTGLSNFGSPQRFGMAFRFHSEGVKTPYANCPLDPQSSWRKGDLAELSPQKAAITYFPQGKDLALYSPSKGDRSVLLQRMEIRLLHLCLIRKVAGSFSH